MIKSKITNYTGNNRFMNSLRTQLLAKGNLSTKQLECAEKFFAPQAKPDSQTFTYAPGDKITIRKWLAQSLAKKKQLTFFFRNLIIEEVIAETDRAIQVKVKFNSEIAAVCHCCGRGLDNEISKATGIGPVCAKKYLGVKRPTMDNAQEIIEKIEQEAKNAGVVDVGWLPKSQLVSKAQKVLYGVE